MWGQGSGPGFVVGEAPGKDEDRAGEPFIGASGRVIRSILEDYGLENSYFTNVAKCHPPKNRKPEASEIKACQGYLLREIEERDPKAILLLGAVAMKAMIGKTKITEMNGQVVEKNGRTYVCCFHPAYILRDPSKESALRGAIARYNSVLNGTFDDSMPEWQAIGPETLDEFIADWIKAERVAFDIETTGLEWWTPGFKVNSIAFTLTDAKETWEKTWGLPLAHKPTLPEALQKEFLIELANSCGGKRVFGQFAKFDNNCLMRIYGVRFPISSDSGLAHHMIDENSAHGLKLLARQFCGAPDYDLSTKEKKGNTSIHKLLTYNCADAAYTSRLESKFIKKMDDDERWLFEKVVIPAARAFERIEAEGHYLDLERMERIGREEQLKLEEARKALNKIAGREVNWNSPPQIAQVLYGDLGLTPSVFTSKVNPDTGQCDTPSTGEEALLSVNHPIAKALLTYREHEKFLSTYIGKEENGVWTGGLRDFMVGPYCYISTKLHGTVTGRFSSRLHSVPRDGTVRNMFTAPPGWTFVQMDLSQAELRVIAITANEPELLRCFRENIDVHWKTLMAAIQSGGGEYVEAVFKTAKMITKKKLEFPDAIELVMQLGPKKAEQLWEGWKEGRKKAKGINFGFSYGQSAFGFINYAKMKYGFEPTIDESSQFREAFFSMYARLPIWHERQVKLAHADGFVRSMSGRKRRLPGIYSSDRSVVAECERQAINAPIQGFIGDYKTMILVELDQTIPHELLKLKGEVHDSVLMWVRNDEMHNTLAAVKEISEHPRLAKECGLKFPIPMTVDIEVGPWGAGKRWEGK